MNYFVTDTYRRTEDLFDQVGDTYLFGYTPVEAADILKQTTKEAVALPQSKMMLSVFLHNLAKEPFEIVSVQEGENKKVFFVSSIVGKSQSWKDELEAYKLAGASIETFHKDQADRLIEGLSDEEEAPKPPSKKMKM